MELGEVRDAGVSDEALAALRLTNVGQVALSNLSDGHDWVDHDDEHGIAWCQWCGVHRVEVPDWLEHPPCPAMVAVRAALAGGQP